MNLTTEQLRTALRYNPETGEILRAPHWKPVSLSAKGNGYYCVEVGGRKYSAVRLAWLLMTGEWPPEGAYAVRMRDKALGLRWSNLYAGTTDRTCRRCSIILPISEFHMRGKTKTGKPQYASYCRSCSGLDKKDWAHHSQCKKYGITIEQYAEMLEQQGGGCAICGTPPDGKRLAVDHCHTTGRVRGLLCSSCNTGLGHFRDDVKLLHKAISYVK